MRECWVIEEHDTEMDEWLTVEAHERRYDAETHLRRWVRDYKHRVVRYVPEPGEEWVDALKWKLAALLKDRTRRDIRARVRNGETAQSVAEDFGVPVQFVEVVATRQMFEDAPPQEDREP